MDKRRKKSVIKELKKTLREAEAIEVDTEVAKQYLNSCVYTLRFFVDVINHMDYSFDVISDCKAALVGLFGYRKECIDAVIVAKTDAVEEDEDASIADCINVMEYIRCGFELMTVHMKLGVMLMSVDEDLIDEAIP